MEMEGLPLSFLLPLSLLLLLAASEPPQEERAALLSFLSRTPHESRVNWSNVTSACTWVGVECDAAASTVTELHLPGVGLVGAIPPDTLSRLPSLRVLSLRSNALSGPIPADFSNLHLLRSLYLQGNRLSGPVPPQVGSMARLARLDLSANNLTGEIPFSLNNLTRLTRLFLQNNGFSGKLPSIDLPALAEFDVSHNRLNGSIPKTLERFPASAFAGNLDLCGGPLPPCNPFFPSPAPSPGERVVVTGGKRPSRKLSTAGIIAISVAAGAVFFILLSILIFCLAFRRRRRSGDTSGKESKTAGAAQRSVPVSGATGAETGTSSSLGPSGAVEGERNKLVFFDSGMYSFDLEDLLRASAEVLGKGTVGTSYKAVLEDGTTVVVKRLKDVAAPKREFEAQMEALGKVKHDNVVPLRAFYYSKDEKLLVCDYFPAGSLSSLLHGSRGSGRPPLDWDNRLRIAMAAGRGLAHLHLASRVSHGNIKASNILLRPDPDNAALSDFGLAPLSGASGLPGRAAGYRAPEALDTRRPTLKSDVYSFGVLLLELLTGKAPNQASLGEEGIDLPRWVQSVVREEWTAEVFDVELLRHGQSVEEEMVQLLQIAMACVAQVPDARPDVRDVVRMMEEIASRGEGGEDGVVVSPSPPDDPNSATS